MDAFFLPQPVIACDTALVCEKYVKKHPVDVSIATEGSGEPHANLFKSESDNGSFFFCTCKQSQAKQQIIFVKLVVSVVRSRSVRILFHNRT